MLKMLALVGLPCLRGRDACMVLRVREASWRNCRRNLRKTSFSSFLFFLLSRMSGFCGMVWFFGIFRLVGLGILGAPFLIEILNVGGGLRGDFALGAEVDFLAVVEHRLILARVRGEWARLRREELASIWAPASQDTSHVGHAAPLSLPSIATVQFQRFFLIVVGQRLALTDQLLDAALGELGAVAREQPCLLVGDFNVEPTKIPCLAKGIMAGLWVDLEASWASASGRVPGFTCRQDWVSSLGSRRDLMVVSLDVGFCRIGGLCLILLFVRVLIQCSVRLCGQHLGYRYLIRVGGQRLLRFRGFGIYMMIGYSLCLGMVLWTWIVLWIMGMSLALGWFGPRR